LGNRADAGREREVDNLLVDVLAGRFERENGRQPIGEPIRRWHAATSECRGGDEINLLESSPAARSSSEIRVVLQRAPDAALGSMVPRRHPAAFRTPAVGWSDEDVVVQGCDGRIVRRLSGCRHARS
jgi:hypothetical protein